MDDDSEQEQEPGQGAGGGHGGNVPGSRQSEKDRRRLLELTGIKEQEVVVWEVVARLDGYRGSDCTGPGPSDNTNTRNISFSFRVNL